VQLRKQLVAIFAALLAFSWAASHGAIAAFAQPGASQSAPKANPALPPSARIDINHASVDELLKAPGMTRTWAARIVRFRPYRTKLDLLDRGVLPSGVYDRIKDAIIAHGKKP
jgi:DNA uptake protein ComE-like DNA-binding protein